LGLFKVANVRIIFFQAKTNRKVYDLFFKPGLLSFFLKPDSFQAFAGV
jgi:hypothetical protein